MIRHFRILAVALLLGLSAWSGGARAQTYGSCTVSGPSISFGDAGSFAVAGQAQSSSGAGGLSCSSLAAVATTSTSSTAISRSSVA